MSDAPSETLSSPDYRLHPATVAIGVQMLFVAFGALVLVPLLTGLDPNVALFTAGAGTLLFQAVTGGRVPVFLASSFAFIPAIVFGAETWGIPATLSGLAAAGVVYVVLAAVVRVGGVRILHFLLPPVVTGPVIMVIGLVLAPVAANLSMGKTGDGAADLVAYGTALPVAAISLVATVLFAVTGRGWTRYLAVLLGIGVGYLVSLPLGLVSFAPVAEASWIRMPGFVAPQWRWEAVVFILPVALAPAIEHFGDVLAIGSVTGRDYLERPGVHRTLLGDGLATTLAALLGGPPNTTYSEVTGAVALTRAFNPAVMTVAALAAIVLSFVGKVGAVLQTIPTPVMGGVLVLLFGAIAVVGLNTLVRAQVDLMRARNLAVVAIVVVSGIGGLSLGTADWAIKGIGLAGVLGVLANLVLPGRRAAAG